MLYRRSPQPRRRFVNPRRVIYLNICCFCIFIVFSVFLRRRSIRSIISIKFTSLKYLKLLFSFIFSSAYLVMEAYLRHYSKAKLELISLVTIVQNIGCYHIFSCTDYVLRSSRCQCMIIHITLLS